MLLAEARHANEALDVILQPSLLARTGSRQLFRVQRFFSLLRPWLVSSSGRFYYLKAGVPRPRVVNRRLRGSRRRPNGRCDCSAAAMEFRLPH
jgi:hypothetical protein